MNRNDFLEYKLIKDLEKKTWDIDRVNIWYDQQPWLVGCNYIPYNAINQLEMFQADTFDIERIDLELSWAKSLGFNVVRVYLHYFLWQEDFEGLKNRLNKFLEVCNKHQIKVLFVLFDDCWVQDPKPGIQPDPIPGIHNSGWAASPGRKLVLDDAEYPNLKDYISNVIGYFSRDERIIGWDLYNEPGSSGMRKRSLPLLVASILWAREVNPTQPITSGIFTFKINQNSWKAFYQVCVNCMDIISFHSYFPPKKTIELIKDLSKYNRPLFCTEYLERTTGNLFQNHLPIFRENKIAAINWGLVAGKTQTIYSWRSKKDDPEPDIWFHDIFKKDGTPYSEDEVSFIRSITKN
jgi:hypothetical protein